MRPGTELDRNHPEWLLKVGDNEDRLLNLGIPACRQWLTDHVCALIQDNGIKVYRQDHNFPPLEYWRRKRGAGPAGDKREPARAGISPVLGRTAGAEPGAVDRLLRIRRPAQ